MSGAGFDFDLARFRRPQIMLLVDRYFGRAISSNTQGGRVRRRCVMHFFFLDLRAPGSLTILGDSCVLRFASEIIPVFSRKTDFSALTR